MVFSAPPSMFLPKSAEGPRMNLDALDVVERDQIEVHLLDGRLVHTDPVDDAFSLHPCLWQWRWLDSIRCGRILHTGA